MASILGQSPALETLTAALRSGRFPHAWIFFGPRGVGKFTTAIELAKVLLDPQARRDGTGSIAADPASEVSRFVESGTHPDLHVIRKELAVYSDDLDLRKKKLMNIPVDVLREHMIGGQTGGRYRDAPAHLTAALGHGKVFIIDEAELLDRTGQNALLKTLEEPPPRTYIFLITNQPQRLLPTIRSRCQHVQFVPLDQEAMTIWFKRARLDLDDAEQTWVEQFCEGSPGLAQLAAEYGFHHWQRALDPMLGELEAGAFPAAMGSTLAELIEGYAGAWVKAHHNASKDAANKQGARHLLSIVANHARGKLAARIDRDEDPARWLGVIDLVRQAEVQLDTNVNLKLLLENLVVQWAQIPAGVPA